jgi:hypothetical protein
MLRVTLVLLAVLVFASTPRLWAAEEVKIVGRDFTFDAPTTLGAGTTTFVFENTGQLRHEMIIVPLKEGVTEQQIREAHRADGITLRKVLQQVGDGELLGILLANPRQTSPGKLTATLVRGRTYLIICQIDAPEGAPRHNILGMYTTFRVE